MTLDELGRLVETRYAELVALVEGYSFSNRSQGKDHLQDVLLKLIESGAYLKYEYPSKGIPAWFRRRLWNRVMGIEDRDRNRQRIVTQARRQLRSLQRLPSKPTAARGNPDDDQSSVGLRDLQRRLKKIFSG